MLSYKKWLQGLDNTPATGVYKSGLSGFSDLTWIHLILYR